MEITEIYRNDVFTDSMVIAEGTGNEHNSVTRILRNYKKDFNTLGDLKFMDLKSKNPKGGRPIKVYQLNEPQATLLITYLDNTEKVRDFKKELVRQFYAMRQLLMQKQSQVWQDSKAYAKEIRKAETDVIKEYVQYATEQGSKHAERYYSIFSTLADKSAGIGAGERDNATIEQLTRLSLVENIIQQCIADGIDRELPYKEIYQYCKQRTESFTAVACITGIGKGV